MGDEKRLDQVMLFGLGGLILAFFWRMAFTDLILARGDTYLYFYPYWHAAQVALLDGRLPLWNTDIFMGAPLLANSQMGFFYPPNWVVWGLFEVPTAVKVSILTHLFVAGWGAYRLGRQLFRLDAVVGLWSAVLFALGGYLTAQVEHVNQLQGLAYLPWLLWFAVAPKMGWERRLVGLSFCFAAQLLAGHTQTTFISGMAVVLWVVLFWMSGEAAVESTAEGAATNGGLLAFLRERNFWWGWVVLAASVVLALVLSAVQLLPTVELIQQSSREGGLTVNEVLSFSWHPLLATASLLPSWEQGVFTEYVAVLPVTALIFGVVGAFRGRKSWPILGLALVGLFLALGRFNGVSWILARLPGFDLFRVPARWLVLYGLGMSLLAGGGLQSFVNWCYGRREDQIGAAVKMKRMAGAGRLGWLVGLAHHAWLPYYAGGAVVIGLVVWGFVAVWLGRWVPVGPESPLVRPNGWTLGLVLGELGVVALAVYGCVRGSIGRWDGGESVKKVWGDSANWPLHGIMMGVSVFVLFLSSRSLPYHNLTTAEAYFDQRPPSLRLQAETAGMVAPARFLSLSEIFFDPGDQAEIDTIYGEILTAEAQYDYTIAIKMKEIVAPNLSMVYEIPSLDGFDGGILPLSSYSELMGETILEGQKTTDGRLREQLASIPDEAWLDAFRVGYIITDKVGDAWQGGVYLDRQHQQMLRAGEMIEIGYVPEMLSDGVRILSEFPVIVHVDLGGGIEYLVDSVSIGDGLQEARWPETVPKGIQIEGISDGIFSAVTLIYEPDGAFYPLTLGAYRLIHSGDVKIYENLDVWSGVTLHVPTAESMMDERLEGGTAEIMSQVATEVRVVVDTAEDGLLVLAQGNYPGWQVYVDGQQREIVPVDGFFRAVEVRAGESEVMFVSVSYTHLTLPTTSRV